MSYPTRTRALWTALAGAALLFAAIAALQMRIDSHRTEGQGAEGLLLRSPAVVKNLSLGYGSLLADIYWTRVVQYYGERVATRNARFDLLWPLLDITTTLDPKLVTAYRFGAIFLSESGDGGPGRTDLAIRLVQRGIKANPDVWALDGDLGFLYYWHLKDYRKAAAAYLRASENPQSPPILKMMAAHMEQEGGSLQTSQLIWSEIYASTQSKAVRDLALKTLRQLKVQQDLEYLNQLAGEYHKRFGRMPVSLDEMENAGLLKGIPVDAEGYPYILSPDGTFHPSPKSPLAASVSADMPSPAAK